MYYIYWVILRRVQYLDCIASKDRMTDEIHLIHSFINGTTAFVGPRPLLLFRNIFYIVGRTPRTGDQPVERPLPTHRQHNSRS
jgi:hypothetical protein